ncbi:hypothetical protein BCR36DRAFT_98359 [Piromyces finnis]|uniref:Uncharacterized protein n=1 Tax=Piromyces finnis TaxID=1754191 RepID=A0A1Y1V4A5_9FUNG|nr:hypothetical protein BCR36DRAFT_98359 [Piromyces finnis]|eukprot:ORX46840.1 hypothetical protein BCR36DRAFT_98359 [Piromyces finnis]
MPTTTTVAASSTPSNGVVAPATPAAPGTPMVPGNATDPTTGQPLLSNVTTGSSNTTEPKVLQELGYHVSTEKEDNNNNIISAMVAIVATGGVATAAVAGFIFVKKNKRFSSKDASLDI